MCMCVYAYICMCVCVYVYVTNSVEHVSNIGRFLFGRTWWTASVRRSSSPRSSSPSSSCSTAPSASSTGWGRRRWGTRPSWGGPCSWSPPSWWCSPSASCPAPWPGWSCSSPGCRSGRRPRRTSLRRPSTASWSCPTSTACWTLWSTASAALSSRACTSAATSPAWWGGARCQRTASTPRRTRPIPSASMLWSDIHLTLDLASCLYIIATYEYERNDRIA